MELNRCMKRIWVFNFSLISSSRPNDIGRRLLQYDDYLIKDNKKIEVDNPVKFDGEYFIVRIYRDAFVSYVKEINQ